VSRPDASSNSARDTLRRAAQHSTVPSEAQQLETETARLIEEARAVQGAASQQLRSIPQMLERNRQMRTALDSLQRRLAGLEADSQELARLRAEHANLTTSHEALKRAHHALRREFSGIFGEMRTLTESVEQLPEDPEDSPSAGEEQSS